ncbi:GTP pyrophosphokinase family protein [Paenalkalicoccus suaedae]|uniref:GTP pyrophosphokinase family protein n=1 Tax=Paenalkalicoccus suaedae TaxID=2592382 RepID=A0A859FAR8_9BACI|nr:GTP pyrophosphokinase family protein [Paenalkalicoccus suaedae]QKS70349.1 GTP pyrophosphokinase family protein [Paenalkalicoccus suaedae]
MDTVPSVPIHQLKKIKTEMTRFLMTYQFAIDEMTTKIEILQQEFHYMNDYNPIEHVNSRLKTPESMLKKLYRKDLPVSIDSMRANIKDIAGIRVTCSFISDIYEISRMLQNQRDVKVCEVKDYIENPKPTGYQSLHLLVEVPVFMSDRTESVPIEIQIRTIAMDFWASLEHKIFYKYDRDVPERLKRELKEAAVSAAALDHKMEKLHNEMKEIKSQDDDEDEMLELFLQNNRLRLPEAFIRENEDE